MSDQKWLMIGIAAIVLFGALGQAHDESEITARLTACVSHGGEWLYNKDARTTECVRREK